MQPTEQGAVPTVEEKAYDELQFYTLARADSRFIHQHVVDAWAAQNADRRTKPITLTFALVGLYLHVEKGLAGRQVQRVHRTLARRRRSWPSFLLPRQRGSLTASSVINATEGSERDAAIDTWCEEVWSAYGDNRKTVAELLASEGIS